MRLRASVLAVIAAAAVMSLSSCGVPSARTVNQPRPPVPSVAALNTGPADGVVMPKGFAPIATKCDHGNRLYESTHEGLSAGSLAVVANDPSCKDQ